MAMDQAEDGKSAMTKRNRRTLDEFANEGPPAVPEREPLHVPVKPTSAKSRQQLPTYIPQNAYEQLRKLAFDERVSMNTLLLEGLDLLFTNRGLKSVSELIESS